MPSSRCAPGEDVEPALLDAVSSLGSGTRVIGVYRQRWATAPSGLCVYLHGVRDPGNVGAVIRTADALVDGTVVVGPGCADPHSPKAVRASMGSVFAASLVRGELDSTPLPRRCPGRPRRRAPGGGGRGNDLPRRRARRAAAGPGRSLPAALDDPAPRGRRRVAQRRRRRCDRARPDIVGALPGEVDGCLSGSRTCAMRPPRRSPRRPTRPRSRSCGSAGSADARS